MGSYDSSEIEEMVSRAIDVVSMRGCDFTRNRDLWIYLNDPSRTALRDSVFRGLGINLAECAKSGNYHAFAYEDSRFAVTREELRREFDKFSTKAENKKVNGAAIASLVFLFLIEKLFARRNGVEQNYIEYEDFLSYVGERMADLRDAESEGEQSDVALIANAYISYSVYGDGGNTEKKKECPNTEYKRRTKAGIVNHLIRMLKSHGLLEADGWDVNGRIVPTERFREFGPSQLFAMSRLDELNDIFKEYRYAEGE